MADMATASLLGRNTAGAGDPEVLSATTARSLLNVEDGATANSTDATLLDRANHTGTQSAATISDFDTEVSNNIDVAANTAKVSYTDSAAVALNTAKVSYTDSAAVALNTAKVTYPSADSTKLAGIEALADVTDSANVVTAIGGATLTDAGTPAPTDQILIKDAGTGALQTADFSEFGGGGDVATDAIWDAKGDLAGGTGADAAARLPLGATNQVLTADSAEVTGMKWTTIAGGSPVDASETVSGVVQIPTDLEVVNATTTGSTGAELPILVTQAALLAGYTTQPSLFTVLRGKLKTAAFPDASLLTSYGYLRLTQPAGDLAATDYSFVFTGGSYNPNIGQNIYNFNWNAKYIQFSVLHTFNTITSTAHSIYWDFGSHYSVADGSTQLTRKGIGFRLGIVGGVKTLYGTSRGTAYNEVDLGVLSTSNILQLLARKVGDTIEWWLNGNLAGSINSTTNPTHVPSGTSSNYQHKYRCGIHMDEAVVGGTQSLHYLSEPIITVLPV